MNNYRSEISQEEFEQIEHYLLGTLPKAQLQEFEDRMERDAQFRGEVVLQRKLMTAVELGSLGELSKNPKPPKIQRLQFNKPWLVAAVFVGIGLFSLLGYLLLRESNSDPSSDLYSAYFYPDPGLPVVMSSTDDYAFYDGMVSYKEGKYGEALAVWSGLPASKLDSDTLRYYRGVALLNLDKLDDAAAYLDLVVAEDQSEFRAKAGWYRALIYIRQNSPSQAIELLENLSPDPRADALLEELKKSP